MLRLRPGIEQLYRSLLQVTVLLPLDWPAEDTDELRESNIKLDDYNRRFSENRPVGVCAGFRGCQEHPKLCSTCSC